MGASNKMFALFYFVPLLLFSFISESQGVAPCTGDIATAPIIDIYQQSDFAIRPAKYDRLTTVQLVLHTDILLTSYVTLGFNYSCTVIRSAGQQAYTLEYRGLDQPGVVIINTHNIIWSRINIRLPPASLTTPGCPPLALIKKRTQNKYVCPAMLVTSCFAITVGKSRFDGSLDVVKTAISLFDSLHVTQLASPPQGPAVSFSGVGWGPKAIRADNTLSNSDVKGGVGVYLAQKCTGVNVVHNYVHHFNLSGISIGFAVHSIADANLNNVSYNKVVNPKSVEATRYLFSDSAGIYFDTHWLGYGNKLTCNYVANYVGHCIYIDYVSSGVEVYGGVCLRTQSGVKINGGKGNRIQGLLMIGIKSYPATFSCQNSDINNCNPGLVGETWNRVIQQSYSSRRITQISPWIKTLCTATNMKGHQCNPASIRDNGYNTGNCSGVPTTNSIRITNFVGQTKNKSGIKVFQCKKIPNYQHFNTLEARDYPGKLSSAGFTNVRMGDFSAKYPQSPIVKFVGKYWVNCPKHLYGIQRVSESSYLERFNLAPPHWFFKYLPLSAP